MKQLRFFFILMAWVCIHTAWGQVGTSSDPLYGKRIGVIGDSYVSWLSNSGRISASVLKKLPVSLSVST